MAGYILPLPLTLMAGMFRIGSPFSSGIGGRVGAEYEKLSILENLWALSSLINQDLDNDG
jgi:hypothetical protein